MSQQSAQVVTHSFPVASVLGILFVTLKLCGVIAWPWVWVLAPFWIPLAIFVAFLLIIPALILGACAVATGILALLAWAKRK
jgi:hypothetical protein